MTENKIDTSFIKNKDLLQYLKEYTETEQNPSEQLIWEENGKIFLSEEGKKRMHYFGLYFKELIDSGKYKEMIRDIANVKK